jgi:hypothetical protein
MFGSWILPCLLHEALPFMSNIIFVLRDTAKPFSPRTILQHTAVSRPRLTKCIASISSVRSKLSRSIDSVFFLSFRGYHDLSHTRPLKSYLVRRNGKFICLGISGRLAGCACFYIWFTSMIRWWIITHVIKTERSSSHRHLFRTTHLIRCLPILSMRPVFSWALLRSGSFSPQLIMLKIVANSFPFGNISTSLTRTHSSMDRLTFLPSTIKKVGTEFVNPTGTFSIPLWSLSQPTSANIFSSRRCWHPHYLLLRRIIGWSFLVGTTHTSYPTLALHHWQKVFGQRYRPFFSLLKPSNYGPLRGVTSGFSANQWRFSTSHHTFLCSDGSSCFTA